MRLLSLNIKYSFKLLVVFLMLAELTLSGLGFCGHGDHFHFENVADPNLACDVSVNALLLGAAGENDGEHAVAHCHPIFHCPCHNGILGITTQFIFSPIVQIEIYYQPPQPLPDTFWHFLPERPPLVFAC